MADCFEFGLFPQIKVHGEPQLGKRGLYPNTSVLHKGTHPARLRMNIIAYCDGKESIFQIAQRLNINLKLVLEELKILEAHDLISIST